MRFAISREIDEHLIDSSTRPGRSEINRNLVRITYTVLVYFASTCLFHFRVELRLYLSCEFLYPVNLNVSAFNSRKNQTVFIPISTTPYFYSNSPVCRLPRKWCDLVIDDDFFFNTCSYSKIRVFNKFVYSNFYFCKTNILPCTLLAPVGGVHVNK